MKKTFKKSMAAILFGACQGILGYQKKVLDVLDDGYDIDDPRLKKAHPIYTACDGTCDEHIKMRIEGWEALCAKERAFLTKPLPPVYISGELLVVYEDDYEDLSDKEKKRLNDYYAPRQLVMKKRPWTFD